jgi:hypothetical protein
LLTELSNTLGVKQKAFEEYLKNLSTYNSNIQKITGETNCTDTETINGISNEIEYVKSRLNAQIMELVEKRNGFVNRLYKEFEEQESFYKVIYDPIVKFVESEKDEQKKAESVLGFNVTAVFDRRKFISKFMDYIDKSRVGHFKGISEGQDRLVKLIDSNKFAKPEDMLIFLDKIVSLLHLNDDEETDFIHFKNQLLGGTEQIESLYNFLYKLEFIDIKYNITFNGKSLNENEFSPGEMGTLLLIFYLLVDRSESPLIIDQPEENLDNESVVKLLVPYIKKAKERRQIILVTHNPNLAVVCDAEQIIRSKMDKKTNQIRYTSGSIESEVMNRDVVNVLEGTLQAFDNRGKKYWRDEDIN